MLYTNVRKPWGSDMKRKWRYALLGFFLGMILLVGFVFHSVYSTQSYGRLINYVGIVRGCTQRLVKLEMNGIQRDDLIVYLDEIMEGLNTGGGKYDLLLVEEADYQDCLQKLDRMSSKKRSIHIEKIPRLGMSC